MSNLQVCIDQAQLLEQQNQLLESYSAEQRVSWCLQYLPKTQVITSSFGIQSAVMLHLLTQQAPNIPVVVVDTGYLFDETYQFIDQLTERLNLNLKVFNATMTPAWYEARFGQTWQQGIEGLDQYNRTMKVQPMQQAFEQLAVATWYSGLRREQANSRQHTPLLALQNGRYKVHPIVDWSNRDVHQYLKKHDLPYHPLWEKGYVSVGDKHTSQPLQAGMSEEETRFFGLKRECGLHEL